MPLRAYINEGPIDNTVRPSTEALKDKSVIVTGGANGFGEAYVKAFSAAGAFVTFGDIDEARGKILASELGSTAKFVKCDTTSWNDQLHLFKQAVANSPAKSVDIVIANAGITGEDEIFRLEGNPETEPTKPSLKILDVNLTGALYTFKLGQHFLRAQPESEQRDRCFIFMGSLAGMIDLPGSYQYAASKFALRGLMRSARRTSWREGIRVNYVAPWYTKTPIMRPAVLKRIMSCGIEFSTVEDGVAAIFRIATDKGINGRSFALLPRSLEPEGYRDMAIDDFDESEIWHKLQNLILAAASRPRPVDQSDIDH